MKLTKLVVCLVTIGIAVASAASHSVTLYEKSTVSGRELKPGDYKLDVSGDIARFSVCKKMLMEVKVKLEDSGQKFDKTTVRYNSADGRYKLQEIRLGGTTTRVVFNE